MKLAIQRVESLTIPSRPGNAGRKEVNMKAKNTNGTWNIYDFHIDEDGEMIGYRTVDDEWLDAIPRKGISGIEFHVDRTLKVTYYGVSEIWYSLVHGTWGFPTKIV